MGFIKVKFGVFNPLSPIKIAEVGGMVDTGAVYSVIHRRRLGELGIKPIGGGRFRALGGYVERDICEAEVEVLGRRRTIAVIMGGRRRPEHIRCNSSRILRFRSRPSKGNTKRN